MIKCFFIDVKSISSAVPISSFDKSKIERLADAILDNDGLIRPLILTATGIEQYTVVVGDLEYYAAVRAKEKDARKAEMVNAFVIPPHSQRSMIEQIALLGEDRPIAVPESSNISISIEQLTSIISQQLQPLQQELMQLNRQLAEQKQTIASISSQQIKTVDVPVEIKAPEIIQVVARLNDLISEPSMITQAESTTAKNPSKQPRTKLKETVKASKQDKVLAPTASTKSVTTKKTPASGKHKPGLDLSIDPIKAASTLNLINTLSQPELQLIMEKSGLPTGVKFVSLIIEKRNQQPDCKFASWEMIMSEVSGLKAVTAKNIINKLK